MKNTVRRLLAVMVVLAMVLSVSGSVFALEAPEKANIGALEAKPAKTYDLSGMRNGRTFDVGAQAADEIAADEIVTIMVELSDAPAMKVYNQYRAAQNYAAGLRQKQNVAVSKISKDLGVNVDVIYNYTLLFNGFSFKGEYRLVEELNRMEGINAFVAAEWKCPEINLYSSTDMVGAIEAWDLDYTGAGHIVAVVDTGMMVDHPAFSTDPEEVRFTRDDIASIIAGGELQGTGASSLTADNVYASAKIPFRWNYVHRNYDVAHVYNDHGTHVAGIAAGNGGDIVGVAKDAQIAAMQVFSDAGGAGWEAILAALEDCVVLGVDSANLSLGSPCGFTHYYSDSYASTFENLVNAGVNLSMSAGNEGSTADNNAWGGYALVQNPDYGVTGSPSTWPESLGIASVDNTKSNSYYIENVATGEKFAFNETSYGQPTMADTFGGQEVEYVYVPGAGNIEDFDGLDVSGKIALIQRGEISFYVKVLNAQEMGAAGIIIFNNTTGTINMDLSSAQGQMHIPAVSIPMDPGQVLADAGTGTIYVSDETALIDAPGGGLPSDFSSWGTVSDLKIKPEITAPGGNIYSSTDPRPSMSGALYQVWSGTSMSAPHVAGGMAIVSAYVEDMFPDASAAERQNLVDAILMSTADPVADKGGDFASVRKQGAGLMDLASAVTTTTYLSVEGCARPKLELGDDPEKTGVYEMTFTVNNFGEEDVSYTVEPHVLIDDLALIDYGPDDEHPYVIGYTQTSWDIAGDCEIDAPAAVTVPAGGTADVTVTVTLPDEVTEYINDYYENGAFIEGFIELYGEGATTGDVNEDGEVNSEDAMLVMRYSMGVERIDNLAAADVNGDGEVNMADALLLFRYAMGISTDFNLGSSTAGTDLNIPFLAYYGDWNAVPIIDEGFYYDDFSWGSNPNGDNFIGSTYGSAAYGLGINPYVETEDLSYYLADRNALSPNEDGFLDNADSFRLSLLRNCAEAGVQLLDAEGNVIANLKTVNDVRKSYYSTSNSTYTTAASEGLSMPVWNSAQFEGQDVAVRVYAYLDNDGSTTTEPFTADSENEYKEWIIPIYVDVEAPAAEFVSFENGALTINVSDNHYAAYAGAWTGEVADGSVALGSNIAEEGIFETERGMTTEITFEGVAEGNLICIADYAGNEKVYVFDGEGLVDEGDSWSHAAIAVPDVDMYAYGKNLNTKTWVKFNTSDMESLYYGGGIQSDDGDYTAATYTGEYVYAVTSGNELVRYNASNLSSWTGKTTIGTIASDYTINEMAYNKAAGKLYAVSGVGSLMEIDPETAAVVSEVDLQYGAVAIDFNSNGVCYIVDAYGYLCTMDVATGNQTAELSDTGISPVDFDSGNFFPQAGTYANGYFYWFAAPASAESYSDMHVLGIEVASGNYADKGAVFGGLYCIGMFANAIEIPDSSVNHEDFYENFEGSFNWELVDADEDGLNWGVEYFTAANYQDGSKCAVSYSYTQDAGAFEPDNWMISSEFTIGDDRFLSFFTSTLNPADADIYEHYAIYLIPEGGDIEDGAMIFETTMDTNACVEHLVDLSDYAGQTVRLAFRHFDCYDQYTLIIDSIAVGSHK